MKTATASRPATEATPPDAQVRQVEGESLADFAHRRLEDMIVSMDLAPGDWVSEPMLSTRLGIGRTPVREALMRLGIERLVVPRPTRGMTVSEIDIPSHLMTLEARRALELVLMRSAARRRTAAEAERLAELVGEFRALRGSGRTVEILRIDRAFIAHLIVCSKNAQLNAINPLYALSRRFWIAYKDRQSEFQSVRLTEFHIEAGEAVIAGDEARAVAITGEFLDYVEAFARHVALHVI
jgi:DNA-binding GntR family transcriptional regulator